MRKTLLMIALLALAATVIASRRPVEDENLPANYIPSGKSMFMQYCSVCHGEDARGEGPLARFLKVSPADLTTLARRHNGKFPRDYVSSVLEFGSGPSVHGSSDMPVWGPLFQYYDKYNEQVVQQRIKRLCDYLGSLQQN